ncbi:DUF1641 domain-containing protein [Marinobacter daepoensis]|uniref:DUF1641 domain-containing protein n=1 Tax=Marinobacter daepoensis TaxID=262077 RepID=A0ABS3BF47_9GAMM|nr:DUF1641 domain-containing protein [Marinobacter daepoensis]MBN7768845.1 DUF1641 domain-containing protein [Marinobacter daepoensis]MBY6032545.1 DUF1641 domain-containing protein [Marinobacter daepoensis]MBY6077535.1 DUF1641 domain-containing protein [Marinobacter daepoensis]
MSNESNTTTAPRSLGQALESVPALQDPATVDGLADLITKAAPLIQGGRLHNIIDLLAATSDVIEMADEAMVQKLMALYEDGVSSVWALSNTLRYASAQAAQEDTPPSVWKSLRRLNQDEDVRRGLNVALNVIAEFGRQSRASYGPMPED